MKKIIGGIMLGLCAVIVLTEGLDAFRSGGDVILFAVLVVGGLGLIASDGTKASSSKSESSSGTAGTSGATTVKTQTAAAETTNTPPAQPQMVCPECGRKYPLSQVYCEECGALLKAE